MFGFGGLSEVLFILFLAMLIFGPAKMPEIARMLAKGMAEVRKASNELKRTLNAELAISEQEKEARRLQGTAPFPPPPAAPPPAPAWSGAQTVPNLDAPGAYAAAPASADVASASADEAPADLSEATAAALTSEAAYLAAWPEDGSSPAAADSAVPATTSTSTSASPAPAAAADSAAPAAPAPPAETAVAAAPADAATPGAPAAAAAPAAPAAPADLAPALVETHGAGSGRDSA
jgi:Sec-independent protein translocase protein TatA